MQNFCNFIFLFVRFLTGSDRNPVEPVFAMNTFGRILRLTSFGESHGPAVGGVLDGFPAGIAIDAERIQTALDRRMPGQSLIGSGRKEADRIELLSGICQGKSLGSPIAFLLRNQDSRSEDYREWQEAFRPSHADDTYFRKYGLRDPRGGGRASARETAVRVAGGAFAGIFLDSFGVRIHAYTRQIGPVRLARNADWTKAYDYATRCPDAETDRMMLEALQQARKDSDTLGGIVGVYVTGMPCGLGEPVYDKLTARLASAMMGLNASRGFEIGKGFESAGMRGSEHNDRWGNDGSTVENRCGGVRGGISTGEDLYFNVAFKPIPTLPGPQVLLHPDGSKAEYVIAGRHDVCCVPRAVPVVEAMTALVLADFLLIGRCSR